MAMGKVYFIECASRIKIGFTRNVAERLKGLATGAPSELRVLATIDGTVHLERAIHKIAKPHRLKGEWFEDCAAVRELMESLIVNGPAAIGFIEPIREPSFGPDTPSPNPYKPFESPLKPMYDRINSTTDIYFGDRFKEARDTEERLGLPKGSLVNSVIGGYYSTRRAALAISMMKNTIEGMGELYHTLVESIATDDPLEQEDLIPLATYFAQRLERGLQRLFQNPDVEVIDISGYDGMSLRQSENIAA